MTFTRHGINCLCRTSCKTSCLLFPELEVVLHLVQPYSDDSHCWKPTVFVEPQPSVLPLETPSYLAELLPHVKGGAGRPRVAEGRGGQDGGRPSTASSALPGVARGRLEGEVSQCPRTRPAKARARRGPKRPRPGGGGGGGHGRGAGPRGACGSRRPALLVRSATLGYVPLLQSDGRPGARRLVPVRWVTAGRCGLVDPGFWS